jgi:hypothetical protein
MSFNRAYTAGDQVQVDSYTPGLNPLPTLGPCHTDAEVLADSVAANWQVQVKPVGYDPVTVYKDRVTP